MMLLKHTNIDEIGMVVFGNEDIVRNKIITKILANYKRENQLLKQLIDLD
jgi:phosphate starvation-inducible protein PhoH